MKLEKVSDIINDRLRKDKDLVSAITGDEGSGKSAFAMRLSTKGDSSFNPDLNELYSPTPEEMEQKVINLPKYSYIIADEAIKSLYKLNWATKGQKYLNELYALCRKENKCSLLCIPRFSDLNEFFRNHRVKLWFHIIDPISSQKQTGTAVMFAPSWSPFVHDPWWFKDNQRLVDEYSKQHKIKEVDYNLDEKIDLLSTSRNFVGTVEFDWVEEDLWKQYLVNKEKVNGLEKKEEVMGKRETKLTKWVANSIRLLRSKGMKLEEISKELGISVRSVENYCEK